MDPFACVIMERVQTRTHCRAAHPDGKKIERFRERSCNAYTGTYPWKLEPTGRIFHNQDDVPLGFVGLPCSRCGMTTEYDVVAPVTMSSRRQVTHDQPHRIDKHSGGLEVGAVDAHRRSCRTPQARQSTTPLSRCRLLSVISSERTSRCAGNRGLRRT
jgi:hypothetical protein